MKSFVIISATFAAIFTAKKTRNSIKVASPLFPSSSLSFSLECRSPNLFNYKFSWGGDTRPALTLLMPTGASCH